MYRKISTIIILVGLLFVGSCQSNTKNPSDKNESDEITNLSDTKPNELSGLSNAPVDKHDYEGAEFRILYPNWFLYNDYFFTDEQNGEQMNDAIYQRTVMTEEHLGIEIIPISFGYIETILPSVRESVLAGDDAYDLVLTHCISGVAEMASGDYLTDWNTLPEITFDNRWWNETINNQLELNGKRLYTVSDYMLGDPNAILFNKRMIETHNLENPYELVKSGDWTWDKLTEMSRKVGSDIDGNGIYDENDSYGFAAQAEWKMISIMHSCDQYIVKEKDGVFSVDLKNEKMISIIEKMDLLFNRDNSSYIWVASENVMQTGIITDLVLFDLAALNESKIYRAGEVDFGILPFPKYDKTQTDYISLNWGGLMCVPGSAKRVELIGKTCEMLAYISDTTTQTAYREVLLNGKLARDDDSLEMLDIIFDGMVCDFGLNYLGFNNLTYTIPRLVARDKSTDFISWYDIHINETEKRLAELTEPAS